MRLFVRLFYILLAIFVTGVFILFVVEPSSVMSRVATGLVTGSFVGLINALANYYHLRQTYFERLVIFIMDISLALEGDYTDAKARNEFISDMTKKQMIKYAAEREKVLDKHKEVDAMKAKYDGFAAKFDFDSFASLWPFIDKELKEVLEGLEMLTTSDIRHLYGEYMMCYEFTLLSSKVSKEEQAIALGDPDKFNEFVVQNNVDYRDELAYYLNELADSSDKLIQLGKHYMSKLYRELLEGDVNIIRSVYLKDVTIRDVIHDRVADICDSEGESYDEN